MDDAVYGCLRNNRLIIALRVLISGRLYWQRKDKFGATLLPVLGFDHSEMAFDDFPGDRESQASTAIIGGGFVGLDKLIKNFFELILRYTDTLITDRYFYCRCIGRVIFSISRCQKAFMAIDPYRTACW